MEGWYMLNRRQYMHITATVKNISDHRITYVDAHVPWNMFTVNDTAIWFYTGSVCSSRIDFHAIAPGAEVEFPFDVCFTIDKIKRSKFRVGFVWTIPGTTSEIEFRNAAARNKIKQKVFWSDTLEMTRP